MVTLLNLRQKEGIFKITNSISKPRHVFVFIINKTKVSSPANNPFLYNTFNVVNKKKLLRCYFTVNNDTYPINHYKPTTEVARINRDVMAYNNFQGGLLNINNLKSLFPLSTSICQNRIMKMLNSHFITSLVGKQTIIIFLLLFYMKNYVILKINDNLS